MIFDYSNTGICHKEEYMHIMKSWASFGATDVNNDNELDIDELKTLIWVMEGREPDEKRVLFDMKQIDEDGSGTVDRLEWISYLVSPAGEGADYFDFTVKKQFDEFDVNKDGMIDRTEFMTIILHSYQDVIAGKKGKDHEMACDLLKELANEIFDELDVSGEGDLDWNEFKTYKSVKG